VNKHIIPILVILLFIVSAVSPMVIGFKSDAVNCDVVIAEIAEPESTELSGPMDSPWSMYCHDVRHTGRSPYGTTGGAGVEKWKFWMDGLLFSSPAIDKNGTIYIQSINERCLHAIGPNGTEKWRYVTGGGHSSPAIAEDGIIYVGSDGEKLHAIYPNGTIKWSFDAGDTIFSSPAIGDDGTIYLGVLGPGWYKGRIYALNPNGTEKWHYDTGFWIYSSPAIGDNGTIYIGSHDNYLYALYPNGTLKWRFKTGKEVKSPPAIGEDGTIYVGSWDGYVYAIYPNGTLKWKFNTRDATETSPTIALDGTIYVGAYSGKIFSISPNGTENWMYETDDWVLASPAIDKYGIIYVGSLDGTLYALNPDGTVRWKFATGGNIEPSPAIGEDGTIYFGADFTSEPDFYSYLYAIEIIENEPPDKPTIDGATSGKIKTEYTYTAVTTDPDGDNVSFYFDWGDGTNSGWTGYVPSGIQVYESHTWSKKGTYEIKVKVQDVYGAESEWATLEVTMPKNKPFNFNFPIISWLLERFPLIQRLLSLPILNSILKVGQ